MFSDRVPRTLAPNRIARAVQRARDAGRTLIDLTATNPTSVGFSYPESMLQSLSLPAALTYSPHPFGRIDARAAVAADYARRGVSAEAARILLTASTSEAYSLIFKLLCAPHGDAVLVPVPSYPLFDHLTVLDGVRAIPYRLEYHRRWTVAMESVDDAWTPEVRALLAVSPNNPTGSVLADDEYCAIASRCRDRDAALIVDEVFADYPLDRGALGPKGQAATGCLTFRLGGLSKSAGLPQLKLGWILVDGPAALVDDALARLEVICDAYLSVSTPVQLAAGALIEAGAAIRAQILARVQANYRTLVSLAASRPAIEVLCAEAGWSAVLRVPSTRAEEDLVLDLLERDGVIVHPGFFFDFPHEAFVVVSLLPEPLTFADGVQRLLDRADA